MNKRELAIFIFLSIITLGLYTFWVFNFKSADPENELSRSSKISLNTKKLLEILKPNNISGAEYTHSKVKIFLKDVQKINLNDIKTMKGISGVFLASDSITIIVGNYAKELANFLVK